MKILAIENEIKTIESGLKSELLKEDAAVVKKLMIDGIIKEIYFNDENCAIILLECNSKEQAGEILNRLPLVKKGYIKFIIMQLNPYTGFKRLE